MIITYDLTPFSKEKLLAKKLTQNKCFAIEYSLI